MEVEHDEESDEPVVDRKEAEREMARILKKSILEADFDFELMSTESKKSKL